MNEAKEGDREGYFIIAPITKMGTYTNYKTYFFTYLEKNCRTKKELNHFLLITKYLKMNLKRFYKYKIEL